MRSYTIEENVGQENSFEMKFVLSIFLIFSLALKSQSYNYYFGNLHSHTGFSDGNKDSAATGVTKPDGSYAYAKQSLNFDFLGISEHNHYSSLRNPGFKLPRYQEGLNMADAANQEGIFLALFGMEYGVSSGNNGHVIVYGFNQLIGWETNISGQQGNNYDIYNAKNDYDGLFKKINKNPNAFAYLAHPYWTDFTRDGNMKITEAAENFCIYLSATSAEDFTRNSSSKNAPFVCCANLLEPCIASCFT